MGNDEGDQACKPGFGYGASDSLHLFASFLLIACFLRLLWNPRQSRRGITFLTSREPFRYLSCSERPRIPPKVWFPSTARLLLEFLERFRGLAEDEDGEQLNVSRSVKCGELTESWCGEFRGRIVQSFGAWAEDGMTDIYAMEREQVDEEMAGWRSFRVVQWGRAKVVNPLIVILKRGTEPKQLAFSAALGFTLGVFPIYGVTALLCGVAIAVLGSKINGPTLILANLIATPFEFSLMIPFLRVGEALVGASPFPLTKDALWQAITMKASGELLHAIGHALLGWLVAGPFLCVALYFVLVPVIKWSQQQLGGQERVPSERVVLLNEEVLLGKKDLGE